MSTLLDKIIAEKKIEVRDLKQQGLSTEERSDDLVISDFKKAISNHGQINLIAEIKYASPSQGIIRQFLDPIAIGYIYYSVGAVAISLLTDQKFFSGDLKNMAALKRNFPLPVLRKDFIIDEIQVRESYINGADAILLIASILSKQQLQDLLGITRSLGMAAIIEVHNEDEMQKAIDCKADIIGINNRNLDTFKVDLQTTHKLATLAPEDCALISESGIDKDADIYALKKTRVNAMLVGSAIMKSNNIAKKVIELIDAGKH